MAETMSDYERARARLTRKRKFRGDVVAYVVINAFLVGIWAVTGSGSFWPGWVLAGWGVLLVLDGWDAYFRYDVTEADIQREMHKSH
jgi:fatty acid desaturase